MSFCLSTICVRGVWRCFCAKAGTVALNVRSIAIERIVFFISVCMFFLLFSICLTIYASDKLQSYENFSSEYSPCSIHFLYLCICFDIIHIKLHIIIYKIRLAQAGVYELEAEENFRKKRNLQI